VKKLSPEEVEFKIPPGMVPRDFSSLPRVRGIIGQDNALKALKLGLNITKKNFNVFVAGEPGTGRTSAVKAFLEEIAARRKTPPDLVFLNNFQDPYSPLPVFLRPGDGKKLVEAVSRAVDELVDYALRVEGTEEFQEATEKKRKEYDRKHEEFITKLNQLARSMGFVLEISQAGVAIVPLKNGKKIPQEEFQQLPEEEKREIQKRRQALEKEIDELSRKKKDLDRKMREAMGEAARHLLAKKWDETMKKAGEILAQSQEGRVYMEHAREAFLNLPQEARGVGSEERDRWVKEVKKRFSVNLAVDNSRLKGAPLIIETNPTYKNLFGVIEREAVYGAYTTDFTMIKAGSLIRANGGFLIIHAEDMTAPLVWKNLKRALETGWVKIEDLESLLNPVSTKGIKPLPIPINVKVVLIGSYGMYSLLYRLDPEFKEVFRIKAEFDWSMPLNRKNLRSLASFFKGYIQDRGYLPLTPDGFEEMVKYLARQVEDRERLSTNFGLMTEILAEADFLARERRARGIDSRAVLGAIRQREERISIFKRKEMDFFKKNILKIEVSGKRVGQINGLTYISIDGLQFGRPVKITATAAPGKEGIVNIEKEAALSGPIHTKGICIINGLLAERFARDFPLTLSARLVFEQSYSEVDGDSASAAEFVVLLSAITGFPVKQNFAVTGSVNQKGEIQAVGGVNEKIEGFFEVCRMRGLRGKKGVVIPRDNIQYLNLKEEVLQAVRAGKFEIHAASTVEEVAEFMLGRSFDEIKRKASQELRRFYSLSREG